MVSIYSLLDRTETAPSLRGCLGRCACCARRTEPLRCRRLLRRALFKHLDCWKHLPLDKFEEGATTGGNVRDLFADAVLVDCGQGVTATRDGERRAFSDRLCQQT